LAAALALPAIVHAQEATLSGSVTDTTGGALPGVTVRAVHDASGNSFEGVTDERGSYRLPLRVGAYRVTADLSGFAPVARTVTLLVGQEAVVNLQMAVSGVQESVTVTGEAPLLDVTQSTLGGNIDPRQMQELPIQGRRWQDLVLLAPGARVNAVNETPTDTGRGGPTSGRQGGDFQLNLDRQNVTSFITGTQSAGQGQPRFSRDAIAEFEFLSNRYDATQGRSSGVQVNAISKSGTNAYSGSLSGYFRHDKLMAADHAIGRKVAYQNQQISGTFGGPIRRDRIHFFGNYEYERLPRTAVFQTPYPHFDADLSDTVTEKLGGVRVDAQFSPETRVMVRANTWKMHEPPEGSQTSAPQTTQLNRPSSYTLMATLTQVLSSRTVNEAYAGYTNYTQDQKNVLNDAPLIAFRGFTAGANDMQPNDQGQRLFHFRNDFTHSFTRGGRHTVKLGAEFLRANVWAIHCRRCWGELDVTGGAAPTNDQMRQIFPDPGNPSTWNLAALSPIAVRWNFMFVGKNPPEVEIIRNSSGVWFQDDWRVTERLTLNLGVRYDLELNAFGNDYEVGPFKPAGQPDDTNNVQPRLGVTFSPNDRTVIRGGWGIYTGSAAASRQAALRAKGDVTQVDYSIVNDGRPDFATNPFNGPAPSFAEVESKLCTPALERGCLRPALPRGGAVYAPGVRMPYSHQTSIGLQRQIGATAAFEIDYVNEATWGLWNDMPGNIRYNPDTGANYPFTDISRLPFPHWGFVSLTFNQGWQRYHALQMGLTKRFSSGWQASGNYTLSGKWDEGPPPMQWNPSIERYEPVPFPLAPDMGGEYGLAVNDQRHRVSLNGLWELPYGFQLSGLYFFGSGQRAFTQWNQDLRRMGDRRPNELRLRPDGTIIPRNDFVGDPVHRVDVRLQRRFPLVGRASIDGMLEIYNLFDHANFGSFVLNEAANNFGQPERSTNVAYGPRVAQLGFRLTF
jgi:hypothetical protein